MKAMIFRITMILATSVGGSAAAASVAYEHDYTVVSDRDPRTHVYRDFQLFDPSLGQLFRATLELETSFRMTASWIAGGDYIHGAYVSYNGSTLYLGDSGLFAVTTNGITEPLYSRYFALQPGDVGSYDSGVIEMPPSTYTTNSLTDPEWLPYLTGTGSGVAYIIEDTSADFGECLGNKCAVVNVATTVYHTARITYEYVPAAVPEPATWALLIMGFGATGARLRSRVRPA